ncbi:MAG: hypothetical protein AB7P08_04955 [Burkholderiales bacterium]
MSRNAEHGHARLGRLLVWALREALRRENEPVADRLLCALEDLARGWPDFGPVLDRAYLDMAGKHGNALSNWRAFRRRERRLDQE